MRKKSYRSQELESVRISEVLSRCSSGRVWIGLDVGKFEFMAVLRDSEGRCERPWRVRQPRELGLFVKLVLAVRKEREVRVGMESTGTYGDALRQALQDAGLELHRVSGKAVSDYAEIFDGVPSAHDGKDAAVVAELMSIGKSVAWPLAARSEFEGEVRRHMQWSDAQQRVLRMWQGRLEGMLSRHWPELTRLMSLKSVTLMRLLATYGGPAQLAQDPEAEQQLRRWGGPYLKPEKIKQVLASARGTMGVRMSGSEMASLRGLAEQALAAVRQVQGAHRELARLADANETIRRMASVVGKSTACVLFATVGNPHHYHCGEAYRKAMGLNLKEYSSGQDLERAHGRPHLRITKRGPSAARRWLFFAALRECMKFPVRRWFEAKKVKDQDRGLGAVVAVMRRLALAVYVVVVEGDDFCPEKLFPNRQLGARKRRSRALSPAPAQRLDLSPSGKEPSGKGEAAEPITRPPHTRLSAPGTALGSVPTGALSSDQDSQT